MGMYPDTLANHLDYEKYQDIAAADEIYLTANQRNFSTTES